MSGNNIIRLGVDNSNSTINDSTIEFNLINNTAFIDNSVDYEVYIRKCEIPISKDLPLFVSREPLYVTLEATDKNDKPAIFGDDLFRTFSIGNSFTSVMDVVNALNAKVFNQIEQPYQWCRFTFLSNHRIGFEVVNASVAYKMKVWVDSMLEDLLEDLPITGDLYFQGHAYKEMISPKPTNASYEQQESKMKNFVNLKNFRLYSDLPTEPYWLYDQVNGTTVESSLLGEITFNSKEMSENTNILYIPNVYSYNSMRDVGQITKFRLNVMAYYANGMEVPCTLQKNNYTSIALVFERKFKI